MFFPIGDVNIKHGSKPYITYLFILINVAVFVFQFSLKGNQQAAFVYGYGSIPAEIVYGQDLYTLITCMFLHGGWMHLIGNMLFMWVFADNIEATIGSFKFILFYIAGGIIASLTHAVLNSSSQIPCVGASGAIAACLGAYLVMFPHSKIRIFFLIFFTTFNISAIYFLGFWILQQFTAGFGAIGTETAGVAYWAHIGGFVFGVFCGFLFREKAERMEMAS